MIIQLREDTTLLNKANNGLSPFDTNWNKEESIVLEAGTYVEYIKTVYPKTVVHTITHSNFSKTITKIRDI
jgi:hypothetical protein